MASFDLDFTLECWTDFVKLYFQEGDVCRRRSSDVTSSVAQWEWPGEMCRDEGGSIAASASPSLAAAMTASMYPFMEPGHMAGLKLASDPGHYSQHQASYHGLPHPQAHHHPAYTRDFFPPHHPMFPHPAADPFSGVCHLATLTWPLSLWFLSVSVATWLPPRSAWARDVLVGGRARDEQHVPGLLRDSRPHVRLGLPARRLLPLHAGRGRGQAGDHLPLGRAGPSPAQEALQQDVQLDAGDRVPHHDGARRGPGDQQPRLLLVRMSQIRQALQGEIQISQPYQSPHWREALPLPLPWLQQGLRQIREPQNS